MRRIAKVDNNQSDLVTSLRKIGAKVQHMHQLGAGCPDLLVAFRGRWFVVEVKDGNGQRLTPDEQQWHAEFSRYAPVYVWTCLDDAMRDMGI